MVRNRDWTYCSDDLPSKNDSVGGLRLQQTALVALPFYHAGFVAFHHCLALDHTVVLLEQFQPRVFIDLIKRYRVNCLRTVPAVMRALLDVPGIHPSDFLEHRGVSPWSRTLPGVSQAAVAEAARPRGVV